VYFIDNDEYFKGKRHLLDEGVMYADNDERAIFFAKVVETVKTELGSRYHVHGWMAAMLPIYMKHYYKMKRCFLIRKLLHRCTVSRLKEL
jgi:starch synthase